MPSPNWSPRLPRPLTIPTVMNLTTLAECGTWSKSTCRRLIDTEHAWRHVSTQLAEAAQGEKDLLDICVFASPGAGA